MTEEQINKLVAEAMDTERLYHQAPCGYITFTTDGTIIKTNATLLNWLGHTAEEVIGKKKFGDLLSKGGQIHFEMFFRPMLSVDGSAKELAYELQTKNGNAFQVLFGAIAMKDETGQILAVNGILTDNTDRRRYEQELLQARRRAENEKERLSGLFMQMPAGVCILDGPQLTFELVNPLYQQFFPGRHLIGKDLLDALPEIKDQEIWNILMNVYHTGKSFEGKELLVPLRRMGEGPIEDRYFNFIYQARINEHDEVDGILAFVIEVTEMVRAREHIRQNEQSLRTLVMTAHYALMILRGSDFLVEIANQQISTLWNKSLHQITGRKLLDILPELHDQPFPALLNNVMQTGEPYGQQEEILRLVVDGAEQVKFVSFYYDPIYESDGTVSGIIVAADDITPQVMARRELEDSYKEQQSLNEELAAINEELADTKAQLEKELEIGKQVQRQKDGFIGMASHELKTPLTSLTAIVQVANSKLKNSDDPFLASAMSKATVQVKRMTAMINGFLNISRLESGQIVIDKRDFDLAGLINELIDEVQVTTGEHHIQLTEIVKVNMYADRDKIGSVLSNFLSNAVKYSPKGTNIDVACVSNVDTVTVSVKDEGMGLRQEDLEKIFDRYYRVESAETLHIAGFGIGLYLSAEIIKQHNGRIWVESELSKGSIFYFLLPL